MPLQKNSPPLPRILAETVLAALCLFTLPLSLDWLSKVVHGQGGGGRTTGVFLVSCLGVVLLLDVYRMMRQRSTAPSRNADQNTGSSKL